MTVERLMVDAYRAGQDAYRVAPLRPNPHDGTSPDVVIRLQALMWMRGYRSQNPFASKPKPARRK